MKIKCVSKTLSEEQAKKLSGNFSRGRYDFGLDIGKEYIVFALSIINGEPWVFIEEAYFEYLRPVPLCLFEIIDSRISSTWEIHIGENGILRLWPASFYKDIYYIDKLSDGEPEILADFRKIKELILKENKLV